LREIVSKKQSIALFLCSIVPWTVGNGLVPLLPVYAASNAPKRTRPSPTESRLVSGLLTQGSHRVNAVAQITNH
jgi:hypothetical protein